jgi:hypothetical protein
MKRTELLRLANGDHQAVDGLIRAGHIKRWRVDGAEYLDCRDVSEIVDLAARSGSLESPVSGTVRASANERGPDRGKSGPHDSTGKSPSGGFVARSDGLEVTLL